MDKFDNTLGAPNITSVDLEVLLPTQQDEADLHANMSILIARTLKKYMLFFKTFGQGVEPHIMHQYSEEMSRKLSVVSGIYMYIAYTIVLLLIMYVPSVTKPTLLKYFWLCPHACVYVSRLSFNFIVFPTLGTPRIKSEQKLEGMVDIMKELQKYVPVVTSECTYELPGMDEPVSVKLDNFHNV